MTQENVVSFARFDKLRREGVLGPATEKADVVPKRERILTGKADYNVQVNLWDIRHLAEYVQPYDIGTQESEGLARLYPAAMPRKPVVGNKRPYPYVRGPGEVNRDDVQFYGRIYAKEKGEKGRYPFSRVQRMPDIIPGDSRSNKERDRMERRALFETIDLSNPDDYPWPGADVRDDPDHENEDPTQGPMSWSNWDFYCCVQTEYRCLKVPPEGRMHYYECYICKKPGTRPKHPDDAEMFKCLICEDVYMCKDHSIFLQSLESGARICCRHSRYTPRHGSWNPVGGYPPLTDRPFIAKQERWQDVDDELDKADVEEVPDEDDFKLTHDLTAGTTGAETRFPRGGTLARGEKFWKPSMDGMFSVGPKDRRHLAEHTGPFAFSDPESHGYERLYPSSRPRAPIDKRTTHYNWLIGMHPITGEAFHPQEEGCYPFSVVRRLPGVINGNDMSQRNRMKAERQTLYELLDYPNPDEYPWLGAKEYIDPYCKNDDPAKGPMNCDLWYNYCMRQTLLRNYEDHDYKHYFCY
eukprot:2493336-Amphidinium_carterae.1